MNTASFGGQSANNTTATATQGGGLFGDQNKLGGGGTQTTLNFAKS